LAVPEGEPEKAIADRRLSGERPSESEGREDRRHCRRDHCSLRSQSASFC